MKIKSNKKSDLYQSIDFSDQCLAIKSRGNSSSNILPYAQIKLFEISLMADEYYHKGSEYTYLKGLQIHIQTDKNSDIIINSRCNYSTLYNILNYKKHIKNFKMYTTGPKDAIDVPLKLFSKLGIKLPIKDSDRVAGIETTAAAFLIMPFFITGELQNNVESNIITLILLLVGLMLISADVYQELLKLKVRKMLNL